MKFSVIVPMHNAERWIQNALDSIAEQTVAPHEIIVIADACSDRSVELVRGNKLNVRVIECTCRNAAAARNLGIRAATGDAIALLDADDYWLSHHLESAQELLEAGGDVAYLSGFKRILPDGKMLSSMIGPLDHPTQNIPSLDYIEALANGFIFGHLTVVYRMERLAEVGLFDESLLNRHDFDLWLRVVAKHTWCCDPQPTAVYRVDTPGSITSNLVRGNYCGLKAVAKSLPHYGSTTYRTMLRIAARRAMTTGLVNGSNAEYQRARKLAWQHLSLQDRVLFGCLGQRSGLLSKAIGLNRTRKLSKA